MPLSCGLTVNDSKPPVIHDILSILSPADRRRFAWLCVGVAVLALTELVGVASVFPFMSLMADPGQLQGESWLAQAYRTLGFTSPRRFIIWAGVAVIVLLVVSRTLGWFISYQRDRLEWAIYLRTSSRLLEYYIDRPYEYFLSQNTADLRGYVITETIHLVHGVLAPLITILINGGTAVVITLLLLFVSPVVALTTAAVLGSAYAGIFIFRRRPLQALGEKRLSANQHQPRVLEELFTGMKTIKTYGNEAAFIERYRHHTGVLADVNPRLRVIYQMPRFILEVLAFSGIVGVTLYLYVREGNLTGLLPTLSLFAVGGYRLLPAMQQVFAAVSTIKAFRPTLDKLTPDLRASLTWESRPRPASRSLPFNHEVKLQNVDFQFREAKKPLFAGLNLSVKKGTTIAFVGSTGSGKTTAVDLLTGLLRPTAGQVTVDGQPLSDLNIADWRRQIAYVPQDVYLYDVSIRENITFGTTENVSDEAITEILEKVELADFIHTQTARGLDTPLGENGIRLSGGQRQRIGLARALLRRPSLLVLDEATSALDTVTERAILDTIDNLPQSITVVLIAHRITTVRSADRIYLLEQGKIMAQGTYEELVQRSERFRNLAE